MELKVVSFNARYSNGDDGENRFWFRWPFMKETLEQERPDIICFQEMLPEMLILVKRELQDYVLLGVGREADLSGEQPTIAYRRDRFSLMTFETFWLSETPAVPGSRYPDQSPCPRTCACALLKDEISKQVFRVLNTHLDHAGEGARVKGITQITDYVRALGRRNALFADVPAILTGDFNAGPETKEVKHVGEVLGWKDAAEGKGGTYHEFGRCNPPTKIDYVFLSPEFQVKESGRWTQKKDHLWLSDHYPVWAKIEV
ncbi:MAG: endonuclease/exonuclease/phosphatase family protein [Lachnospiraceae bacterium]|nr:endonuclease/exonuclease/phosphatase family protein [Lachnospiraceae bacterium]